MKLTHVSWKHFTLKSSRLGMDSRGFDLTPFISGVRLELRESGQTLLQRGAGCIDLSPETMRWPVPEEK
jgi:hypothetical protein